MQIRLEKKTYCRAVSFKSCSMFSFKLRINTYAVCARHSKEKISKQQSDRRIFKTSQTTSNERTENLIYVLKK